MILRSSLLALLLGFALSTPARADLSVCNSTTSRIGVSLGYRDSQGWVTEGWWNLKPNQCEKLLSGRLAARFYYVYGVDYDRGGEWAGDVLHVHRRQGVHHTRRRELPVARL